MNRQKRNNRIIMRKPRTVRERGASYAAKKLKRAGPIRYKPIPLKYEEWHKYPGEYFVFLEDQILTHGSDLDKLFEKVEREYGKKQDEVVLFKVPLARHMIL